MAVCTCMYMYNYHTVFIPSATIVVPVGPLELSPPSTLSPPNTTNSTQSGDTTCADREWLYLSVTDVGNVSCDKKIYILINNFTYYYCIDMTNKLYTFLQLLFSISIIQQSDTEGI